MKHFEFLLPPFDDQKRIVEILWAADKAVEAWLATFNAFEIAKQQVLRSTFTSENTSLNGWRINNLKDVATIQTGLAKGKKYAYGEKLVERPYLRVANVKDGYLDLSEIKTISVTLAEVERFSVRYGDVLVTEGGDFDKVGRGTVWNGEIEDCLHQNHVFCVRPKNEVLLPEYLSFQTASPYGKVYFLKCAKKTSNLASINSTQLKNLDKEPSALSFEDLTADFLSAFLDYVEKDRGNCIRTRNARLAAIHSFFRYVSLREPAWADLCCQILAIPSKRFEKRPIAFLTPEEINALLDAPDKAVWIGRRDRTLLLIAIQTGLRVSELISLRYDNVVLGTGAHVRCEGKGRKQRCTPLRPETAKVMSSWLCELNSQPDHPVFPSIRGGSLSRDAVERLVSRHCKAAQAHCPSLTRKKVTPHVLRHYGERYKMVRD